MAFHCLKPNLLKVVSTVLVLLTVVEYATNFYFTPWFRRLLPYSDVFRVGKAKGKALQAIKDFFFEETADGAENRTSAAASMARRRSNGGGIVITADKQKPVCTRSFTKLGRLAPMDEVVDFDILNARFPNLKPGGRFAPMTCRPREKVAVIVPYKNRETHLKIFLNNMHPLLQRQLLDYGIFIIEQDEKSPFNRGMLMNIGFVEASKTGNFTCFIFHDVDLIPEDDRNVYGCDSNPRHMSVAVDTFRYRLPYKSILGGITAFRKEHFRRINGFSNQFFGWGGEDDDLYNRVRSQNLKVVRHSLITNRYRMISHNKSKANPKRWRLLFRGFRRFASDGLNSLSYRLLDVEFKSLFTWVYARINGTTF